MFSCTGKAQNKTTENQMKQNIIEVYDFHTTNRCMTCKAIEANTKYTLETYFADELKSGKITFQVINLDEKENESLGEKFYASGTSLYLNVIKNGDEKQIDLTQFAFMYGKKKDDFSKKLKQKLEKQLAKI
jgi:TPP-dependent trihydroxycyclohexane-1,2-dione (THcHDO) dehydratase